jgi:hypothetical protein
MKTINVNTLSLNFDLTLVNIIGADLKKHHENLKTQFLNLIVKEFDRELFDIISNDLSIKKFGFSGPEIAKAS